MPTLEEFLVTNVLAFMLVFTRIGTAMMIMPGVGDSFSPQNVRLLFALAVSVALAPMLQKYLPDSVPSSVMLFSLIVMEFIIGLFFGTITRIFMTALDTAGMIISLSSGLSNAQLFNPTLAGQGSVIGAFLSVTGVVLLFATNLYAVLLYGLVGTYESFPVGEIPDAGSMAELISKAISSGFLIGVQISMPFIVAGLLLYIGMGVLARLMPQIQVFILALPIQISLSLVALSLMMSSGFLYWLSSFDKNLTFFLTATSP